MAIVVCQRCSASPGVARSTSPLAIFSASARFASISAPSIPSSAFRLAASVDDAAFLYVAHDVAPRAMSPKVKGFVQPKSWFVDFSPVSMTP